MRFIHTADWHQGRIFQDILLLDNQRHALGQLIAEIEQRKPDAVIIAGNIYDRPFHRKAQSACCKILYIVSAAS